MNNKCKYHKIRSRKKQYYGYCTKYKKEVPLFCKCNEIEYKQNSANKHRALQTNLSKVKKNDGIKKKSARLSHLERNRFSILQEDCSKCLLCNSTYQLTWHEVFEGKNRLNSMRYGLCLRICLKCHQLKQEDALFKEYWHQKGQLAFIANYPDLNFLKIFRINYL